MINLFDELFELVLVIVVLGVIFSFIWNMYLFRLNFGGFFVSVILMVIFLVVICNGLFDVLI